MSTEPEPQQPGPKGPGQREADPIAEEDLVPEDDRVIGTAFRWSLAVIVGVAVLAALITLLLRREEAPEEAVEAEVTMPRAVTVEAEPPAVSFTDVAREAGIDYVHFNGATGEKLLPESMGGGGGFVDVDGDGAVDIVFVGGAPWPHDPPADHPPSVTVYRNLGGGRFADSTDALGLGGTSFYGMGLTAADYDGDGRTDLYVTAVGENHLFRNTPSGFVDVTARAGVAGGARDWSTGAAFFDYDGDGDLDLFVCNYVEWSRDIDIEVDYRLTGVGRAYGPPINYRGTHSHLYRNEGDGTFTDVSAEAGIQVENPATGVPIGKALAVAVIDIDGDDRLDLLVANDTVQNFFFHNLGDGRFEETGELYGLAYDRVGNATGAMGIDAGYYRNDNDLVWAIGNFANEMTSFYVSQGDPTLYADEAIPSGIGASTRTALSFGVLLLDYDLDGYLDLAQSNGHLEEEIGVVDPSQSYEQPAQLFWNNPQGGSAFVPVDAATLGDLTKPIVGRGMSYADFDGDGDLDLLLMQLGGSPLLLRNEQALGHHWVRVRLAGSGMNRDAIGATVELISDGVTQRRTVTPGRSYLSQIELPVTFGLGEAASVDSVVVRWPDGTVEDITDRVVIDSTQTIQKP